MKKLFEKTNQFPYRKPLGKPGWVMLASFIVLNIVVFSIIDSKSQSVTDTLIAFIPLLIFTSLLVFLAAYNLVKK